MAGSSIHFKKVARPSIMLMHNERLVSPPYLIEADTTQAIIKDCNIDELQRTYKHKLSLASKQAKAVKDYSPLQEGVMNLPAPKKRDGSDLMGMVKLFADDYEKLTNHKVLGLWVHMDEGHIEPSTKEKKYNYHAHIVVDRTNEAGRVEKMDRVKLRKIQDLAAKHTGLSRGDPSHQTRRKHLGRHDFIAQVKEKEKALASVIAESKKKDKALVRIANYADELYEDNQLLNKTVSITKKKILTADYSQALDAVLYDEAYKRSRKKMIDSSKEGGQKFSQEQFMVLKTLHEGLLRRLKGEKYEVDEKTEKSGMLDLYRQQLEKARDSAVKVQEEARESPTQTRGLGF